MLRIRRFLEKIKNKYKSFKKNESGGDVVNQILTLAIAVLIIGLILVFAVAQFNKAKDGFADLFTSDGDSEESESNSISQINTQDSTFIENICDAAVFALLDKSPLHSKIILPPFLYITTLNNIKTNN